MTEAKVLLDEMRSLKKDVTKKIDNLVLITEGQKYFNLNYARVYTGLSESQLKKDANLIRDGREASGRRKLTFTRDELDNYMNKYWL